MGNKTVAPQEPRSLNQLPLRTPYSQLPYHEQDRDSFWAFATHYPPYRSISACNLLRSSFKTHAERSLTGHTAGLLPRFSKRVTSYGYRPSISKESSETLGQIAHYQSHPIHSLRNEEI